MFIYSVSLPWIRLKRETFPFLAIPNTDHKFLIQKLPVFLFLMISMVNPKKINYFFESMILPTGLLQYVNSSKVNSFPPPCPEYPLHSSRKTASIHPSSSIGPFCYIGKNVNIGSNSHILSHCHIGDEVRIGSDTKLHPGVKVLSRCEVGNKVILNAGVVLGSEGYVALIKLRVKLKTPQLGTL